MGEMTKIEEAVAALCGEVRADQQRQIADRISKKARAAYDAGNDEAGHALAKMAQELQGELA